METKKTMFDSLLKIQKELKTISKNKQAFKGKYATIEKVWESIRNLIAENGFVVYNQSVMRDSKNGLLTTAKHETGESIDSFIEYSSNEDPQERGKEITYYRRYNINSIFNVIVEGEDNDATKPLGSYEKEGADGRLAAEKIMNAKDKVEARKIYALLSPKEKRTSEVVEAVKFMKDGNK